MEENSKGISVLKNGTKISKKKKKRESLQKSILVKITWKLKKDYSKKSKKEIGKKNSGKTLEEEDNFYKTLFQAMNFGPADKNGR